VNSGRGIAFLFATGLSEKQLDWMERKREKLDWVRSARIVIAEAYDQPFYPSLDHLPEAAYLEIHKPT
jgi:hypothetical protein